MRVTAGLRALLIWLCAAAVFAAALFVIERQASPLDDPKPARERPGYLDATGERRTAPLVTISRPAPGKVTVIFFVRTTQQGPLVAALARQQALPADADVVVVGGRADLTETRFALVTDVDTVLARGYEMPVPRDGGYPVGYAVVGPDGTIRYRTLDPGIVGHLNEVRTILAAVR